MATCTCGTTRDLYVSTDLGKSWYSHELPDHATPRDLIVFDSGLLLMNISLGESYKPQRHFLSISRDDATSWTPLPDFTWTTHNMFESPQFIASGNEVFIRASQTRDFDSNATSDILNISVFGVVDNRWQKLFKLEDFATLIGLTSSLVRVNGNLISITTDRGQHWSVLEPPSGARLKVFGSGNTLIATYNDGNSHIYYRDLSTAEWVQAKD